MKCEPTADFREFSIALQHLDRMQGRPYFRSCPGSGSRTGPDVQQADWGEVWRESRGFLENGFATCIGRWQPGNKVGGSRFRGRESASKLPVFVVGRYLRSGPGNARPVKSNKDLLDGFSQCGREWHMFSVIRQPRFREFLPRSPNRRMRCDNRQSGPRTNLHPSECEQVRRQSSSRAAAQFRWSGLRLLLRRLRRRVQVAVRGRTPELPSERASADHGCDHHSSSLRAEAKFLE